MAQPFAPGFSLTTWMTCRPAPPAFPGLSDMPPWCPLTCRWASFTEFLVPSYLTHVQGCVSWAPTSHTPARGRPPPTPRGAWAPLGLPWPSGLPPQTRLQLARPPWVSAFYERCCLRTIPSMGQTGLVLDTISHRSRCDPTQTARGSCPGLCLCELRVL